MEKIKLIIDRGDNNYTLMLDSKIKLEVDCINLHILSIENNEEKNDRIYVEIVENQFYQTKEVGAYCNVIYINDILYNEVEGPSIEIRLSLICLNKENIRHIFIRAKKFLL